MIKSIVVFCGSSNGEHPDYGQSAYMLGETMAKQNRTLVYGGAKIGLMGKVAQGCLDAKGKVIGVIPDFLKAREVYHKGLTQLIITENMQERKLKMHELSEAIITLPGGYGTLEELFEMITWAQLGLHQKPIGILNVNGFYNELLQMLHTMVHQGFLRQEGYDMLLVDKTIDGLLQKMEAYKALHSSNKIKKDKV